MVSVQWRDTSSLNRLSSQAPQHQFRTVYQGLNSPGDTRKAFMEASGDYMGLGSGQYQNEK